MWVGLEWTWVQGWDGDVGGAWMDLVVGLRYRRGWGLETWVGLGWTWVQGLDGDVGGTGLTRGGLEVLIQQKHKNVFDLIDAN